MPTIADAEGSEDVNDFLLRIKELGDQRDREDEERTRKLEEEIIQGRKQREARRAERARSLSPTKDNSSVAGTPGSVRSGIEMSMQEESSQTPSLQPAPSRDMSFDDSPRKANGSPATSMPTHDTSNVRELPRPPSKPQTLSSASSTATAPLARTGNLSWQQRPSSRGSAGSRTRPLSMLAPEKATTRSPRQNAESAAGIGDELPRSQIAQSLGSRDPSWFKQTRERGMGSAAFRKNHAEDTSDTASTSNQIRLPGMSMESPAEPESQMSPPAETVRSNTSSREGSVRSILGSNHGYSNSGSISFRSGIRSPLPTMASQRFEPASSDVVFTSGDDTSSVERSLAMSPSQGRMSPERADRPTSPTKGLGGFVQSAMLKRSDSVNKRWSAQAAPGLSRGNSTASNLSGYGGPRYPLTGITPLTESRPNSISRESSPTSQSRPTSSHNKAPSLHRLSENDKPDTSIHLASNASQLQFEEKVLLSISRESKSPTPPDVIISPPLSPSKRWSPTKSSWLENAINKPDSPKIKLPASQQPSWMAEINRAKQLRGSIDAGKESNFKEVATGGLARSSYPGADVKPSASKGFASSHNSSTAQQPPNDGTSSSDPENTSQATQDVTQTTSPRDFLPSNQSDGTDTVPNEQAEVTTTPDPTSSPSTKTSASPKAQHRITSSSSRSKPETSPKKDFKSTLRPRQTSGTKKTQEEPEFKNVFGNLKRTQTKNYVAPDKFKDTIMRGKAGLAQSAGPKKTERRDEFKESILQKKQGMVVPSASTTITSASSKTQEQPSPEAIAKRRALGRSESTQSNGSMMDETKSPKAEALAKLEYLRDKPKPALVEKQSSRPTSPPKALDSIGGPAGGFTASLAGILQRGPSPSMAKATVAPSPDKLPDKIRNRVSAEASEPQIPTGGPQLTHATKARARGPKRRLPTASTQQAAGNVSQDDLETPSVLSSNRNKPADLRASLDKSNEPEQKPLSNITRMNDNNRKSSQPLSPRKPSTTIVPSPALTKSTTSELPQSANQISKPQSPPLIKQKLPLSPKGATTREVFKSAAVADAETPIKRAQVQAAEQTPSYPVKELTKAESQPEDPDTQLPSVKGAAATWARSSNPTQPSRARAPIKLPTRKDEEAALEQAGLIANGTVDRSGMATVNGCQPMTNEKPPLQAARSPGSPPIPGKKPSSIASRVTSISLPLPATPQPKQPPSSPLPRESGLFIDIFDEPPSSKHKINTNTQSVLDSCSLKDRSAKIKTLRKQISEVGENGKSVPVPVHQEHILFDRSIYLCSHVFGNHTGQRTTEVYLWCGDAAAPSMVENAQITAKKFAKDNSGKLMVLKQGKETTNFFQALGGIVITRRGSATRMEANAGSANGYILCGRQHVGQIAFDEVDYSAQSLCKGFPFILATPGEQLFLWKGSGSGADELGCARLIGMDLGLSGEIEEVDDGREPEAFWRAFPASTQVRGTDPGTSGQYWHLKPSCENYNTRLFNVNFEAQRPKSASSFIQGAMQWGRRGSAPTNDLDTTKTASISEVMPFAQSDLVDDGVFVLDAFFEVFVIFTVRSLAPAPHQKSSESLAFRAALLFAQEYGILAASAEDRPFVPQCSVVICSRTTDSKVEKERVPDGMVRAFRKWDDGLVKNCRVVELTKALEAMGEQR